MTDDDFSQFERFCVSAGTIVRLDAWDTRWSSSLGAERDVLKERAETILANEVKHLAENQEVLWADNRYALLLVFQGIDASGKDGTIEHLTSGINPAGVRVVSFKEPSREDLDHNFLWRYTKALPEHGTLGVFNRSYYEEVVVVRVHPEILAERSLPEYTLNDAFWAERFDDINTFERHLVRNGTLVIKFFLHLSKDEQRERLLARLDDPDKHWKFSFNDLTTRERWDDYTRAFEAMLTFTSTPWAPWWVIPADQKWAMRALVAQVVCQAAKRLNLRFPSPSVEKREQLKRAKAILERDI